MDFITGTVVLSGIAWTITYVALVYRGFKDRTYGMPLAALALNVSWEFTYSLVYPPHSMGAAAWAFNALWMVCDLGIVATFLIFGYDQVRRHYELSRGEFYLGAACAFAGSMAVMLVGGPFFKDFTPYFRCDLFESAKFIAFVQNAVMSALFVSMFYLRRGVEGQSFTIAWTKWIGTSMTVGLSYLAVEHPDQWHFVGVFVALSFIFDVWYTALIYRALRRRGLNPWTRL